MTAINGSSSAPLEDQAEKDFCHLIEPRLPQKRDENKPSLNSLGMELILIIFKIVHRESPASLKSLALVSSHYHHAARYCQNQKVRLHISEEKKDVLQRRLAYLEQGGFLPAIRRIKVRGVEDDLENIEAVAQFLQKATGLTDLDWANKGAPDSSVGVPEQVLTAIQSRSTVRLHTDAVLNYYRQPTTEPPPPYTAPLARGSENLHSLRMRFTYVSVERCLEMVQNVRDILLSSPNIRKLTVDYGRPDGGCVRYGPPKEYTGFGFVDGQRPSALEELNLGKYIFGSITSELGDVFPPTNVGYPGKGQEEDYWVETFDWSRLRKLDTKQHTFALRVAPKLSALEEASLGVVSNPKIIREFYDTVPNFLHAIEIHQFDALGVDGIIRHASKLKSLGIHQRQSRDWSEHTIDAPSLLEIQKACPLIEALDLDIKREGDWPYEILDILAGFRNLRRLTLWFELGWVGHEPFDAVQPVVNYSAVETLLTYLNSKRPPNSKPLKELKVYCGCLRPIRGYPSSEGLWPRKNTSSYICRLSERDDQAPNGVFHITCPMLTDDENTLLQKMRTENVEMPKKQSRALRVALNGPVPFTARKMF
uniref:F-box domain-containing protein n=1 Tax=Bionectria ochroleuca TaxID=29856 RepID=A0A8H7K0Z3_BIOOC